VALKRVSRPADGGRTIHITTTFTSTDANAHTVRWQNVDAIAETAAGAGAQRLPWIDGAAFVAHPAGVVASPTSEVWRADVAANAAVDGSADHPRGAVVMDRIPTTTAFIATRQLATVFELPVTPSAPAAVNAVYVSGAGQAEVDAAATTAMRGLTRPTARITSPVNGSTVDTTPATVTGVVGDSLGGATVTLNGRPVTPAADGTFTATLRLTAPSSAITLRVVNAGGNVAEDTVTVNFTPIRFIGTNGPDVLTGNARSNVITGLAGNDRISCGVRGRDTVNAGPGADRINCVEPMAIARANRDTVNCGPGRDTALVDPFDRVVACEVVTRVWIGTNRRNTYVGTRADDRFDTRGGNDVITCGGGRDLVLAGAGADVVRCRDAVPRRANADVVRCGPGRDTAIVDRFDRVVGCERVIRR